MTPRVTSNHRRSWTNAKLSGETLHRRLPKSVARKGDRFIFGKRQPMMALCRNGLTSIEVVDL
jgi:hypothetical protein